MNTHTVGNDSAYFEDFDSLLLTTPRNSIPDPIASLQYNTIYGVFDFIDMGTVIFGTISNIMTLAVFRMYPRSSKSPATLLLEALCVVDTGFLLGCVCNLDSLIDLYLRNQR